jgi:Tol biopolymer transport system component
MDSNNPLLALSPNSWSLAMQSLTRSIPFALASLISLVGAAVNVASAATPNAQPNSAQAQRKPTPPPPPPAPASDSTLALASASATGRAVDGDVCAVSGDGGKVLFTSSSDTLVSGDNRPFLADIFLKNFNGNGVMRAVTTGSRSLACLAMTPDANTVVFAADASNGQVDVLGNSGTESAILVQNQTTGQQTRVTPLLSSFPNVSSYQFAGISDDGQRVAFIAQPTRSCSGYDCTALGPARMLVRDLSTGQLINLENQVRFTTAQGVADGDAWLSPNGRLLAFSSRVDYPQIGDTNAKSDVFALDIATGNVRLVSTDVAGIQLSIPGFFGGGPTWGVQTFLSNSGKIAFYTDYPTSAGPAGVYVKDLATGALNRVLDRNLTFRNGNRAALSFSDDGRKVAYVEDNGLGGSFSRSLPRVRDVATGALLNAATLTNGTVGNGRTTTNALLSRDGRVAAFSNNATNLLGGAAPFGGAELRAYRKLLP